MANTVYGPYAPTTWVFNTTMGTYTRMNNIEKQAGISLNGFNGDLLTPFVLSGLVCTKDGTTANQLDVTAGRVYIQMTDGTVGLIVTAASAASQFLTATPSTTYYLDLNPDGTWSWGTAHSAVANHLTICSATTDASGNILAVTDARTTAATLLRAMAGKLTLPSLTELYVFGGVTDDTLLLHDRNGVLGVSMGWAQSGGGFYAFDQLNNGFIFSGGTKNSITFPGVIIFGPAVSGSESQLFFVSANNALTIASPQAGATALGLSFQSWTGAAAATPFSVGGQFNLAKSWVDNSGNFNGPALCSLPTTRNGTATSARIYTGTGTPSSPRAGDIWLNQ